VGSESAATDSLFSCGPESKFQYLSQARDLSYHDSIGTLVSKTLNGAECFSGLGDLKALVLDHWLRDLVMGCRREGGGQG